MTLFTTILHVAWGKKYATTTGCEERQPFFFFPFSFLSLWEKYSYIRNTQRHQSFDHHVLQCVTSFYWEYPAWEFYKSVCVFMSVCLLRACCISFRWILLFFTLLTIKKIQVLNHLSDFLSKTTKYYKFSSVRNCIMKLHINTVVLIQGT